MSRRHNWGLTVGVAAVVGAGTFYLGTMYGTGIAGGEPFLRASENQLKREHSIHTLVDPPAPHHGGASGALDAAGLPIGEPIPVVAEPPPPPPPVEPPPPPPPAEVPPPPPPAPPAAPPAEVLPPAPPAKTEALPYTHDSHHEYDVIDGMPGRVARVIAADPGSPPPQYLIPMQVLEGFGAYPDGVVEMFRLAKTLNRWLVEPCVRNACVEPCRCDDVIDAPDIFPPLDERVVAAGGDPLGLPALPARCKQFRHYMTNGFRDEPEPAYPLRAYLDTQRIANETNWPYVITYKQWCTAYKTKAKLDVGGKYPTRWREARSYCYDFDPDPSGLNNWPIGDMVFTETLPGRAGNPGKSPAESLQMLKEDTSETIFLHNYYRHFFFQDQKGPAIINPWHEAAVDDWIKKRFEGKPYAVFHWRHEFADKEKLTGCTDLLVDAAHALPELKPEGSRVVMVVDMPPPGQKGHFWVDNYPDPEGLRTKIVQRLLDEGFRIYDADHVEIDSGILAIRSYLVGVKADLYITYVGSQGGAAGQCFKPGSNFITRIETERRRIGKSSFDHWPELKAHPEVRLPA